MKKYQYIVAAACIMVGILGFAGMYVINQGQKEPEDTQIAEQPTETEENGHRVREPEDEGPQLALREPDEEPETENEEQNPVTEPEDEEPVESVQEEVLHFQPERGLVWPLSGPVLLDYSMDGTIYYPTLNQYQYCPAMVIGGTVNSKVYIVAKGRITDITTNEVTGCTVTQDLGDGYTAIYGQLKELNVEVGDILESGQVIGYVGEPTKYFAVEGPNVYFQVLKDGVPMNPVDLLGE